MAAQGNLNVFINCPFDSRYRRLFRAVVFTIFECGFIPRCALEVSNSAQSRLHKILDLIEACQHGIHDISRTQINATTHLPRFNMPFELGLFLGAHRFGGDSQRKQCLVMDTEPFRYQKFLSDISGQDISAHENDPEVLVRVVRNWLNSLAPFPLPGHKAIWKKFEDFQTEFPKLCLKADLDVRDVTYRDLTYLVSQWLTASRALAYRSDA